MALTTARTRRSYMAAPGRMSTSSVPRQRSAVEERRPEGAAAALNTAARAFPPLQWRGAPRCGFASAPVVGNPVPRRAPTRIESCLHTPAPSEVLLELEGFGITGAVRSTPVCTKRSAAKPPLEPPFLVLAAPPLRAEAMSIGFHSLRNPNSPRDPNRKRRPPT
jgi:hypothetical protein